MKICRLNYFLLIFLLLPYTDGLAGIYRWVDKDGNVHYGDKKPLGINRKSENLSDKYSQSTHNFKIVVTPVNYKLPLDTKVKVIHAVKKVFYILSKYNRLPFNEDVDITIKIFGDQKEFIQYRNETAPGSRSKTGYFSHKNKEAVVWKNRKVEEMLSVITHEAFHTIMSTNYNDMPVWLDEGFAEYFEQIDVFGTTAVVRLNTGWDNMVKEAVRNNSAPPLADYLALDSRKQWREKNYNAALGYAIGWSLMYFLMSSEEGRTLILDLFRARAKESEATIIPIIESSYPGGLSQLENRWKNWSFAKKYPHRY